MSSLFHHSPFDDRKFQKQQLPLLIQQSKSKLFYCVGDLLDVLSRNYDSSKFSEFYNVKGNKGTEFHIVFVSGDRDDANFAQY